MALRDRYRIDDHLVSHLGVSDGDVVVELGCGPGVTLAVAAEQADDVRVIGLDLDAEALVDAGRLLSDAPTRWLLAAADLSGSLPLAADSVDRLLCHNVLEQLPDPSALFLEGNRVMRSGAVSVWSHTDFESVIINGGSPELTRRIVQAYAHRPDTGAAHADGQMGRKLASMVGASPLERAAVDAHIMVAADLTGPAELRVRSTFALVREASLAGQVDLTIDELERWMAELRAAADKGAFFYSQTTFMVIAIKP